MPTMDSGRGAARLTRPPGRVADTGTNPSEPARPHEEGRSARKRRAIMDAATTLFLRNGYQGTSMDEIAALAAVSKQTVYKNFADKEHLFTDIILGITDSSDKIIDAMARILQQADDLERALTELARGYITAVLQPHILRLRRLVIAEADRFPDLARSYFLRGPERAVDMLAFAFSDLAERGLLRLPDARLAACHFAYLILSIPQDKAMFCAGERFTAAELEGFADAGVRVFLAAYRTR
jgi:TetR/AcrR family transcriptional regulator, mexJK operon transcriptional repressor